MFLYQEHRHIGVKGVLWTGMATDELIVKYAI